MPWLSPFIDGLALGGGLIIAIGAQNAFILKQGIRRQFVLPLVLICSLADALLIWGGAYLLGAVAGLVPAFVVVTRYVGTAFLVAYGLLAAWRATKAETIAESEVAAPNLAASILVCLGFTFLNPHVYLDTVILVGSIATQYPGLAKPAFCAGATAASFIWFFGLGYGARLLAPLFRKPLAWRILDGVIAVVMLWLAWKVYSGA